MKATLYIPGLEPQDVSHADLALPLPRHGLTYASKCAAATLLDTKPVMVLTEARGEDFIVFVEDTAKDPNPQATAAVISLTGQSDVWGESPVLGVCLVVTR